MVLVVVLVEEITGIEAPRLRQLHSIIASVKRGTEDRIKNRSNRA